MTTRTCINVPPREILFGTAVTSSPIDDIGERLEFHHRDERARNRRAGVFLAHVRRRENMKIAIVGGGIGGLTTALAMTQAGFSVTVYERAPQLVDQGAGITLAPNATRVLYHLGLGEDLEATAVTPPM